MKNFALLASLSLFALVGCQCPREKPATTGTVPSTEAGTAPSTAADAATSTDAGATASATPLSWDAPDHPERAQWSRFVSDTVTELLDGFDSAQDAELFCPKYKSLSKQEKVQMWSEMFSAIAKFESGWQPTSRMKETTMGKDPVTGQPVYSEGLLQLSYQDTQWAKYCRFDWNADKLLAPDDPNKTILQPLTNLDCGIRIMAAQIGRYGKVIINQGAYWAVLKEGGKYNRIPEITAMTKSLRFCQ